MPTPLHYRRLDWLFIVAFATFAATSLLVDIPVVLGSTWMRHLVAHHYGPCDPLMVALPPFLRVAIGVSAFIWGPVYLYFIWGFVGGHNRIRPLALCYAGAVTLAMLMIFAEELWSPVSGWATPQRATFFSYNLCYLAIPLMLGWRMRSPYPFGGTEPG